MRYGECSKISNVRCLPKRPRQTGQTQIRLFLQKQSDQGHPCLLFWQAFCESQTRLPTFCLRRGKENFRTFTVSRLAGFLYIAAAEERAAKVIKSAKEPVYLQPFKDTMTEFFQKGIVQDVYFSYNKWILHLEIFILITCSKTCVKWLFSKSPKLVVKTNYRLMQVKSIAGAFCNTFDLHWATICH